MAYPRRSSRSDDDDPEEEDEEESPSRRRRARHAAANPPHPVRRWHGTEEAEEPEEASPSGPRSRGRLTSRERHPVYWRARDSLYFEPLVALAIIVVLLVGLYAYTQNWPPVYVVESDSMQHGSDDVLGLINTGDLVLAQSVGTSSIVPYMVGLATGYSTYGEYGDVLLYHPNGGGGTPVIHRALLFLTYTPSSHSYDAPELNGLPCGTAPNAAYATPGTPNECGTTGLTGTLELNHIGWKSANVSVDLSSPALGAHSGFLTMGDNNFVCAPSGGCIGNPDQEGASTPAISELVEPAWVIGVARGMIPWFGALKLLLEGNTAEVPSQSWQFLGLTVAGVILLAFGIHYALRAEGIETPLRREEEEEEEAERESEDEAPDDEGGRARHWLRSLRPWRREEDEEDEEATATSKRHTASAKSSTDSRRRGRPRPRVRRAEKSARDTKDDDS